MAKLCLGLAIIFAVISGLGVQIAAAAPEIGVTTPTAVGSARHGVVGATTTTNVVVRNTGDANLAVSGATFVGGNTGDFALGTVTFPLNIAGGGQANIPVVFDPTAVGARSTSIRIASNDATDPTEDVVLNGTGTAATITLAAPSFGALLQGGATATGNITVTNSTVTNQGPLHLTSASMPAMTWFSFGAGAGCTANSVMCALNANVAGTPLNVPVQCKPPAGASGTTMTTVTFVTDADSGTETVNLSCTAGSADVDTDLASIAFGAQKRNTNGDRALTIRNLGTFTLTYDVAFTGTDAAMFSIVSPGCTAGCTLAPGSTAAVTVRFRPTSTGAKSATLSIDSNDFDEDPYTLGLTGTGTAPIADIDPPSQNFNNVEIGATSAPVTFTVMNAGDASLVIASATVTTASYTITAGPVGGATVAPGNSVTYDVECSPQAQAANAGQFRLTSDTGGVVGTITNITLACNGTRGFLAVNTALVNFGGVAVGNESTLPVTLTNTGNLTVSGITAVIANPNVGYSIVSPTFPITLIAGQSQIVQVKFAPQTDTDGGDVQLTFAGTWGTGNTPVSVATTLRGDGLSTGLDVSPATLAFGDIRWDAAPFRYICVRNTGQAGFNITMLSLAPTGVTSSNELKIIRLIKRTCGTGGGVPTPIASALPYALGAGESVEVEVQANPEDRTGALAATVTLVTDLPANGSDTTPITANSTTAGLTTAPGATVDFGAVDIDGPAQMQTISITNTGDGPLDLNTFTKMGTAPAFGITLPVGARTLLPTEHLDIVVTFDPTVERAANQPEMITVAHNIVGVLGGPTMGTITITGRGVDRHLQLGTAPEFPPTFRNPGSMAPTRTVALSNTGEAPLAITAVMVTNQDVWQLVDSSAVTIPPLGSHDFEVRFTPTVAGAAPTGTLTFTNDDNGMPMAMVLLDGIGRDRQVGLIGDPIQLGFTGIGIPLTLPDGLVVQSMDTENAFAIREIVLLDDSGVFTIEDGPRNEQIDPSAQRAYDITFAPDAEGEFEAQAQLFLDEDPTQAAQVTIRGQAVFVDVGGGGGCSTSRGGAGGLVLAIGALLAGLRRRARHVVAASAAVVAAPAIAHAQGAGFDLDLSQFDPTPSTTNTTMQVQSADVGRNGDWVASALVANASNPLVLNYAGTEHAAIARRTTFTVGGAYAFLDRFEAGAHMPLYNQAGDGDAVGVSSPSGTARGDLVAHVRAQLLHTRGRTQLVAGASLAVTFPTASGEQFAGVDKPTARLLGLLTIKPSAADGRLAILANAGPVFRGTSALGNYEQGSGASFGTAISVRLLPALWAAGELFGEAMPSSHASGPMEALDTQVTLEWLVGASFRPDPRFAIGAGVGSAVASAPGTSDLRAVFSISIMPTVRTLPPIREIFEDSPNGDNDDDGILNSLDKCPDAAEDKDRFEDTDGCPELDNDHDTFADDIDPCPLLAEDVDGTADGDGCPDVDDDNDGIPDTNDKCPREAEDKDGFADDDGCPEPDNDRDGVYDAADKCPTEAENINGLTDDDGCPDAGDSAVQVTPSAIELLEAVKFNGAKLGKGADKVLGQVAATLRAHPEILRLKINVHVDAEPDDEKAKTLTEQRAIVIRDYLIKAGIAPERISGAGWGGSKPLVKDKRGAFNERIELIILERK